MRLPHRVARDHLTALWGDDAVEAPADSLAGERNSSYPSKKEKTEHVERADWEEDGHDPDLR